MAAKHIETYTIFAIQITPRHVAPPFPGYFTPGIHFCYRILDLRSPKKVIVILSSKIKKPHSNIKKSHIM